MKESNYPTVNYIGNKLKISDWIVDNIPIKEGTVLDIFAGGCSVSYALKKAGYTVYSNDMLYSNYALAKAIIENNTSILKNEHLDIKIDSKEINKKYKKINFLVDKVYFDYEVKELSNLVLIAEQLSGYEKYIFIALLRRAMIRKIPYSRMNIKWEEIKKFRDEEYSYRMYCRYRSYHNKEFMYHIEKNKLEYNKSVFDNSKENKAFQEDAFELLQDITPVDVVYLDPPYPSTMNDYNAFYGYFDEIFNKKIKTQSTFVDKNTFIGQFEILLELCQKKTEYIVVSLNNKTKPGMSEIEQSVTKYFEIINILEKPHVYKVTGKVNKQTNSEVLIIGKKRR